MVSGSICSSDFGFSFVAMTDVCEASFGPVVSVSKLGICVFFPDAVKSHLGWEFISSVTT